MDVPDRTVAVFGAGETESVLRQYATLIEEHAGMPAQVVTLDRPTLRETKTALRDLPAAVGVIVLPHPVPEFACRVRALTEVPVVTGQDTTAIALTAAVLTTLTRAGRTPRSSQVVIAGADMLPVLCPALMVGGVGSVTTWNSTDAVSFPLGHVIEDVDVVVDLLTDTAGEVAGVMGTGTFTPPVVAPEPDRDLLLALPGLVRAMTRTRPARLDVEIHHACALALVMATPPNQVLPLEPDRELADQIAEAATTAFRESTDHPHGTTFG